MTRKLYVKSYGCQMNVYDSHRMADTLAPEGYVETATPDDADLVILNTCHIREKAAEKVYSELGRIRELKETAAGNGRRVHGRGRRLRRAGRGRGDHPPRAGGRSRGRPAELSPPAGRCSRAPSTASVGRHRVPGRGQVRASRGAARRGDAHARRHRLRHRAGRLRQVLHLLRRALYARRRGLAAGRARSSPRRERLADAGVREVTLLGQNVNAYHGEGPDGRAWTLGRLLHRLAEIPGHRAAALHHQPSARHGRRA